MGVGGTPQPQGSSLLRGSSEVQINGGHYNVAGRDSHTHIHYHGATVDLKSPMSAIPNFRKIHQDTLAKATPNTGMWLLKGDTFSLWLEPNGDLRILWGIGIREFRPSRHTVWV